MFLTKSDLQSFLQCPRKLWLEHHRQDLMPSDDDPKSCRRKVDGNIVGEKARQQLGTNFIWPPGMADMADAAHNARELLAASPDKAAAEVPMVCGNLYARADALIPEASGYVLRETKASSFRLKKDKVTPDVPDSHHLNDVAIQAWVMEGSGLTCARVELNYLNNLWLYPGNEDYAGLFRQIDVTEEAKPLKLLVPDWLQQAENTLASEMPATETGKQCKKPYECPFKDFCIQHDPERPEHPIELLPESAGKKLAAKMRQTKGYESILEPSPGELVGAQADLYRRIQLAHRTGQAVLVPGSDAMMANLPYPRYFFDFEGIDLPVPCWVGVRPFEQIPFQWSCHIERSPGVYELAEFLDLTGDDPSLPCIQRMREVIDTDDGGPIFVYFATYEKGRLEGFAKRHPEHAGLMQKYIDRLVDLLPLVKKYYYHPAMRGSFSIKKLLPVISPSLDYGELDEVQDGIGAQVAYLSAAFDQKTTPERKADLEAKMRIYCRQDTWAMVEVAYFFANESRPVRPSAM
jgi:CRISPR/Cas system-associated exonuclease Cas4 (RecB family)